MIRSRLIVSLILTLFVSDARCWADAPVGERTIKVFHDSDFSGLANGWASTLGQNLLLNNGADGGQLIGFAWVPLFDGSTNTSILVNFGAPGSGTLFGGAQPQSVPAHLLLSVDDPQIGQTDAALVGRWASPNHRASDTEDLARITLTLKVGYADGTSSSGTVHLVDNEGNAGGYRNFRLPIASHSSLPVRSLTLLLATMPYVPLVFEDLRIVESSKDSPNLSSSPLPGLPAGGLVPSACSVISRCDFDPMMNGQSGVDPVVVLVEGPARILELFRRPADGSLRRISIASIDASPVSAGDFGATGTIRYAGLDGTHDFDGSAFFELTASFADGTSRVVGTTAAFGPCQKISGHSEDRPMELAMHSAMQPTRLQLQLVSDGVGQVSFSNLSFVQFNRPPVAVTSLPPSPSRWNDARLVGTVSWCSVLGGLLLSLVVIQIPNLAVVRHGVPIVALLAAEILFGWAMFLLGQGEPTAIVAPLFAGPIACILPLFARQIVFRRLHQRELRKMLTIDAA